MKPLCVGAHALCHCVQPPAEESSLASLTIACTPYSSDPETKLDRRTHIQLTCEIDSMEESHRETEEHGVGCCSPQSVNLPAIQQPNINLPQQVKIRFCTSTACNNPALPHRAATRQSPRRTSQCRFCMHIKGSGKQSCFSTARTERLSMLTATRTAQ